MLRLLQLHWLTVFVTSADSDVSDLLQRRMGAVNYSSPEALKELAEVLVLAKKECLASSVDCIGTLKQVRYRVWPFVQQLLGKRFEGFDPVDFHPQVAKATLTCDQQNRTLMYMHVWKAAGYSLMENLHSVGSGFEVTDSFEDNFYWCENLGLNQINPAARSSFTFVREPLARFVSGYAEIDRTYLGPRYDFFHKAPPGSLDRAKLFAHRFFQDGLIFNGHVKPQSEYFAPFSSTCKLPIDYVGKIEQISEDWKKLLESQHCDAATISYNNSLGQHPTDPAERHAMYKLMTLQETDTTGSDSGKSNQTTLRSSQHLQRVLQRHHYAFLRAFCWIHLPDYVMFDYDLPGKCNDQEIQQVKKMTMTHPPKKTPVI